MKKFINFLYKELNSVIVLRRVTVYCIILLVSIYFNLMCIPFLRDSSWVFIISSSFLYLGFLKILSFSKDITVQEIIDSIEEQNEV